MCSFVEVFQFFSSIALSVDIKCNGIQLKRKGFTMLLTTSAIDLLISIGSCVRNRGCVELGGGIALFVEFQLPPAKSFEFLRHSRALARYAGRMFLVRNE